MQNNPSTNQRKKILYVTLSLLLVVAIASATAYVLSRVSEPTDDQGSTSDSLTQKLTEVYKSSSDISQDVTLGTLVVQDSGTAGYKNAHATILGANSDNSGVAHFYRTPDETWHFFMSALDQDKLSCSNYDTEDLINAFVGFTCKGTKGSSFVQHEQPEFEVVPGSIGE